MLDIDSHPLGEPLNDLTMMSALGPPRSDGPSARRFSRRCIIGLRADCDEAETSLLPDVIRRRPVNSAIDPLVLGVARGARVSDVHDRRKPIRKTNVSDSMVAVPCGFPFHCDAQLRGQMADFLEKAT
jgi:hypothetical protein